MVRRFLLVFLAAAAACLVPWTVYLAAALPDRYGTGQWRLAWVGFDVALLCCFAVATWLGLRRHRAAVPLLAATAALLCCDAWFDVVLDWTGSDRWTSVALAVLVELPLAALLLFRARSLLVGGVRRRTLTLRDIELHDDRASQRLFSTLDRLAPATTGALANALGRPMSEVGARLQELADDGYVHRGRDGRWSSTPQDLRMPDLDDVDDEQRPRVAAYLDAKFDTELELFHWAATHRDEFGRWGKGSRARMHLTAAELAAFDAEYVELLTRYSLLRRKPTEGTRQLAVRFYTFPMPDGPTG